MAGQSLVLSPHARPSQFNPSPHQQLPALALAAAHACLAALVLATRGSLAAQAALLAGSAAVVARGAALNAWLAGGPCLPALLAFPPASWDAAGGAWAARVGGPLLAIMLLQVACLAAECWELGVAVKKAELGRGGGGGTRRARATAGHRRRKGD